MRIINGEPGTGADLRPAEQHMADAHPMSSEKLQALVLRIVGTVECFAFVAVVVPFRWMEAGHGWLGLGEMPDGAVVRYLIREASFVFGLHGVLLWLLAADVERFRPLILFTGFSYFIGGPVFAIAGAAAGMPWFWFIGEGLSCLAVGIVVLWLVIINPTRSVQRTGASRSAQNETRPSSAAGSRR